MKTKSGPADYVGAVGLCEICGAEITLEEGDISEVFTKHERMVFVGGEWRQAMVWRVKCPTCKKSVGCYHREAQP